MLMSERLSRNCLARNCSKNFSMERKSSNPVQGSFFFPPAQDQTTATCQKATQFQESEKGGASPVLGRLQCEIVSPIISNPIPKQQNYITYYSRTK
jgi:hypothetical protein